MAINLIFLFILLLFSVAAEAELNKMNLNNLATVFGPNLLRPGTNQTAAAAWDVISPVNVLMFFLTCPMEVYDDPSSSSAGSAPSSESKGSKKRSGLPQVADDDATSMASTHSTGFTTASLSASFSPTSPSSTLLPPPSGPVSNSSTSSSSSTATTNNNVNNSRYKQSVI